MSTSVLHVFYDVHMGASHVSLSKILKNKVRDFESKKDQVVVFINKKWTACKILAPGNILLYYRDPSGEFITVDAIRRIPLAFGGGMFGFSGNNEAKLISVFERENGHKMERLNVV